MNQIDLKGRVAVITGGAHPQGIGYAAAERMLHSGASVVLWDIDAARLAQAEDALTKLGTVSTSIVELSMEPDIAAAGVIALTSTPLVASSFASDLVSAISPAFEAL